MEAGRGLFKEGWGRGRNRGLCNILTLILDLKALQVFQLLRLVPVIGTDPNNPIRQDGCADLSHLPGSKLHWG